MESKNYKRIPLFENTKKRLRKAKEDKTYDAFINYLLSLIPLVKRLEKENKELRKRLEEPEKQ